MATYKEIVPRHELTRRAELKCHAVTTDWQLSPRLIQWRAEHYSGDQHSSKRCQRWAAVLVDGKPYCRQHAGQIALKEKLEGN